MGSCRPHHPRLRLLHTSGVGAFDDRGLADPPAHQRRRPDPTTLRYLLRLDPTSPADLGVAAELVRFVLTLFTHEAGLGRRVDLPAAVEAAVEHVYQAWTPSGIARPVALAELARAAALSPGQLSKILSQRFGVGPVTAFELLRLARAAALLPQGRPAHHGCRPVVRLRRRRTLSHRFRRTYGAPRAATATATAHLTPRHRWPQPGSFRSRRVSRAEKAATRAAPPRPRGRVGGPARSVRATWTAGSTRCRRPVRTGRPARPAGRRTNAPCPPGRPCRRQPRHPATALSPWSCPPPAAPGPPLDDGETSTTRSVLHRAALITASVPSPPSATSAT